MLSRVTMNLKPAVIELDVGPTSKCPLWVISGHLHCNRPCPQLRSPSDMSRPSRTQTWLWSGAPWRTARLASRSHGPTGSPSRLSPSRHTLTRSFSSKAKARHGMPWSSTVPCTRNSSSSRSRPGDRRTGGISHRRKAPRARNSQTRLKPAPLNSAATMTKSTDAASKRFNV
jgi:hypothetical protein